MAALSQSRSLRVLNSVGSFLGVTESATDQRQWDHVNQARAQRKQIGLVLSKPNKLHRVVPSPPPTHLVDPDLVDPGDADDDPSAELQSHLREFEARNADSRTGIANFGQGANGLQCIGSRIPRSPSLGSDSEFHDGSASQNRAKKMIRRRQAIKQYNRYTQMERQRRVKELQTQKEIIAAKLKCLLRETENLAERAKEYYRGTNRGGGEELVFARLRTAKDVRPGLGVAGNADGAGSGGAAENVARPTDTTEVPEEISTRLQLEALTEYRPWFTYILSISQVLACVFLLVFGGVTSVGLEPTLQLKSDVQTLLGLETKEHWRVFNIWVGPSAKQLIALGAVFAPCMREDVMVANLRANTSSTNQLGCCESYSRGIAATTDQAECDRLTQGSGNWSSLVCGERLPSGAVTHHKLRPCCHGVLGQCQLTTFDHCTFLEGHYHASGPEHCSQVDCFAELCGGTSQTAASQTYRLLVSVLYHGGLVHMALVVGLQVLLARPVEKVAGWLRMALLYFIPSYMGLLAGAVMSPFVPHTGGDGGLSSLFAVALVDLVQSWRLVDRPWRELAKISAAMALFLLAGTLPYVDNFTFGVGFVTGVLCGVTFLPYVSFGRRSTTSRRLLIAVCVPALLLELFVVLYLFYEVQTVGDSCGWCRYVNCVPYSELMCKTLDLW